MVRRPPPTRPTPVVAAGLQLALWAALGRSRPSGRTRSATFALRRPQHARAPGRRCRGRLLGGAGGSDGNGTLQRLVDHRHPGPFACAAFAPAVAVTGTKTVSGTFSVGGTVTYTVTLTNNGTADQADNAGHEFTDALPASLTLVSATATSGTAGHRRQHGQLGRLAGPAGGSVTITITATINAGTARHDDLQPGHRSPSTPTATAPTRPPPLTDDPAHRRRQRPDLLRGRRRARRHRAPRPSAGTFTAGQHGHLHRRAHQLAAARPQRDNPGNEFTDVLPAG